MTRGHHGAAKRRLHIFEKCKSQGSWWKGPLWFNTGLRIDVFYFWRWTFAGKQLTANWVSSTGILGVRSTLQGLQQPRGPALVFPSIITGAACPPWDQHVRRWGYEWAETSPAQGPLPGCAMPGDAQHPCEASRGHSQGCALARCCAHNRVRDGQTHCRQDPRLSPRGSAWASWRPWDASSFHEGCNGNLPEKLAQSRVFFFCFFFPTFLFPSAKLLEPAV